MKAGWKYAWPSTCVSIPPLHPSSPPQKHSFPSSSSRSPPNPSLLHCICFLIRSVWEAHEPPLLLLTRLHPRLSLGGCNAVTCFHSSFFQPCSPSLSFFLQLLSSDSSMNQPAPTQLLLLSPSSDFWSLFASFFPFLLVWFQLISGHCSCGY